MILVKIKISKKFDIIENQKDIKKKLYSATSLNDWKKLMDNFEAQGKIKKRKVNWKEDDINWIYESIIVYDSIEAHQECFNNPVSQTIIEKLIEKGFEIDISFKEISEAMAKQI